MVSQVLGTHTGGDRPPELGADRGGARAKVRIEVFDKAQAVIDNQQATGAAALIAALQGEEHACIRVGSLLRIDPSAGTAVSPTIASLEAV